VIAVVDTNVLVSGLINPMGPPGRIVDLLRTGVLTLAVDDRIVAEYEDVLRRPELASYFAASDVDHIMEYVRMTSARVIPAKHVEGLPDDGDVPFLEVALESACVLVTGNVRHYPKSRRSTCVVESPAEFMRRFAKRVCR
jgi:putative PIN family toxin of toxin-antitoxin system